jgi:hypothetical protein
MPLPLSELLAKSSHRNPNLSCATFGGTPLTRFVDFATFHMAHLLFAELL